MIKLTFILAVSLTFSGFQSFGQDSFDFSNYNKKERRVIIEFTNALNTITSTSTKLNDANETIKNVLPLFELEAGSMLTIQKKGIEKVARIEDYLNKAKLLKLYLQLEEITFNKKGKIKSVKLKELNDIKT